MKHKNTKKKFYTIAKKLALTTLGYFSAAMALAAPQITSLSTYSGAPGTAVTIYGNDFNPLIAGNEVWFGATRGTVTAASATQLTAYVAAGATLAPVSVRDVSTGNTAYSSRAFVPSFATAGFAQGEINFGAPFYIPTAFDPTLLKIHDIDVDGRPDIVLVSTDRRVISIYRNIHVSGSLSAASFDAPVTFNWRPGNAIKKLEIADVNGDGRPDLVASTYDFNPIRWKFLGVRLNNTIPGNIDASSFATPYNVHSAPGILADFCITDMEGDGRPDIAALYSTDYIIDPAGPYFSFMGTRLFRNITSGGSLSFDAPIETPIVDTLAGMVGIDAGDIDGDLKPELVVTGASNGGYANVYQNFSSTSSINYSLYGIYPFLHGANEPKLIDWNGDGLPEISGWNSDASSVVCFLPHNGFAGTIVPSTYGGELPKGHEGLSEGPKFSDLDGDGRPDYVCAQNSLFTFGTVRNQYASGALDWTAFSFVKEFTSSNVGDTGYAINSAVGDLNGDGYPDVVVSNSALATLSIMQNNPMPVISGNGLLCITKTTALTNPVAGGTWTSGNTAIATVNASSGVVQGVGAGTATITYTFPPSFGGYVTQVVTVNPALSPITGASYLCPAGTITLSNSTSGGGWTSSLLSVATVGNTSGIVTGVSAGTTTITYTSAAGCTATKTVNVMTTPGAIAGPDVLCQSSPVVFTNTVVGGTWSSSNTSTIQFPTPSSGNATAWNTGTATVTYTTCGIATKTVTVTPALKGVFASPATVCAGSQSTLSVVPNNTYFNTVASIPYTSYSTSGASIVTTDDGSASVALPFLFRFYGTTYSAIHVNANGFVNFGTATSTNNFTARALPSANAPVTANPQGMLALFWHDMNPSVGGSINTATIGTSPNRLFVISYNAVPDYSGSATNSGQIILHENSGIIDMMIGSTGGGTAYNKTCGIQNANASVGVAAPGQNGVVYSASNIGWRFSGAPSGSATYAWSPAATLSSSTAAQPIATPTSAGSATYSVTVSMPGCVMSGNTTLTVNTTPSAISGPSSVCAGSTVGLSASPSGGFWGSSNTSVATVNPTTGVVGGTSAGTATISYWIIGTGCMVTRTQTVNALPSAGTITASATTIIVGGTATVTSNVGGGTWSSSNTAKATVNSSGLVSGVSAGNATISYSVTGVCGTAHATKGFSIVAARPGIQEGENPAYTINLFPNPNSGSFNIEVPAAGSLTIFTVDGKLVLRTNLSAGVTGVSLPTWVTPGAYTCRYDSENGKSTTIRVIYQ